VVIVLLARIRIVMDLTPQSSSAADIVLPAQDLVLHRRRSLSKAAAHILAIATTTMLRLLLFQDLGRGRVHIHLVANRLSLWEIHTGDDHPQDTPMPQWSSYQVTHAVVPGIAIAKLQLLCRVTTIDQDPGLAVRSLCEVVLAPVLAVQKSSWPEVVTTHLAARIPAALTASFTRIMIGIARVLQPTSF